jgi:tripartite ATP-independent transporter DctP family solute receptor
MMTRTSAIRLAALLCAGTLIASAAEAATRLRVAGNFPVDHSATGAMEVFKKELETATKGDLAADLFPAMQLGGATENVDQVRSGAIFSVFTSVAYFSRTVPEIDALNLPFLFGSREEAFRVIDGKIGRAIDEKLAAKGFINLGYMELGFRHVTNNVRPIKSIDDLKGLKIRLQPSEAHLATFRLLGANPQAMDIKEVYSALQQGVLDGQENPYNITATRRFNEVQKYLSDTGHFFDFINVVANKRRFESLKAAEQKAIRDAMAKAVAWQRQKAAEQDLQWRDELVKRGMQFSPVSPETRAQLRKATAPMASELKKRIGPEFVDVVLAEISK